MFPQLHQFNAYVPLMYFPANVFVGMVTYLHKLLLLSNNFFVLSNSGLFLQCTIAETCNVVVSTMLLLSYHGVTFSGKYGFKEMTRLLLLLLA